MRTTIDLPEPLLRRMKAQAALDGMTLKALVRRFVEQGLRRLEERAQAPRLERSEIPVLDRTGCSPPPAFGNKELHDILDQQEVERELRIRGSS